MNIIIYDFGTSSLKTCLFNVDNGGIAVFQGIKHSTDHLTVGNGLSIGGTESEPPDLQFFHEGLRKIQRGVFDLCHHYKFLLQGKDMKLFQLKQLK